MGKYAHYKHKPARCAASSAAALPCRLTPEFHTIRYNYRLMASAGSSFYRQPTAGLLNRRFGIKQVYADASEAVLWQARARSRGL